MAFSFIKTLNPVLQAISGACTIKEKLRKHLRKSAFVSDEQRKMV